MNYSEVKDLISVINNSSFTEFELSFDNLTLKMSKAAQGQPEAKSISIINQPQIEVSEPITIMPEPVAVLQGKIIKSPIVGTFYISPGEGAQPFAPVGKKVKVGDILCIVEAMKIMNEVPSEFDGEIVEVLAENGVMVEFGQPLFRLV